MTPEPSAGAPPIRYDAHPYETCVEGETWIVRQRAEEPGTYDFDWVSGPNEGYGFGLSRSDGAQSTEAELDERIRDFLADIDPATGFLPD